MGTIHGTTRDAMRLSNAIDERTDYTTNGALWGRYYPETRFERASYVIFSYNEPIAFMTYDDRHAVVSYFKHSVTTSRHQSVALAAMAYSAKRVQRTRYRVSVSGAILD